MTTTPPPGSPEAVKLGCRCPVMDNHHGAGYMGIRGVYVYSGHCTLHNVSRDYEEQEITTMETMKTEDLADIADIDLEADDQYLDEQCRMIELLTGSKALAKACVDDPVDYAMKLRTGEVIAFSGAQVLNREWVHLRLKPMDQQPKENQIAYPADRGVDVRLSDIVWVMDAPLGS